MRTAGALCVAVAIAGLTLFAASAPSHATTAQTPTAPSSHQGVLYETPMHIVGFDTAAARAHGYRIVTRNGVQMSVSEAQPNAVAGPDNSIGGNCGWSWIYLYGHYGNFQYNTGFGLYYNGYDFYWLVHLYGPYFWEQSRTWGGLLYTGRYWRAPGSGNYTVYVDDKGYYRGVVATSSYAILDNGGVCTSAGPTSTVYVSGL